MTPIYIVIGLAALQVYAFALLVGIQRGKRGINAPATTGDEVYERYHRVHYNTLEQFVVFVPAILLFGTYVSVNIGVALGMVYVIARFLYLNGYVKEPRKRAAGFGIGWLAVTAMLLGGLGGAVLSLF